MGGRWVWCGVGWVGFGGVRWGSVGGWGGEGWEKVRGVRDRGRVVHLAPPHSGPGIRLSP